MVREFDAKIRNSSHFLLPLLKKKTKKQGLVLPWFKKKKKKKLRLCHGQRKYEEMPPTPTYSECVPNDPNEARPMVDGTLRNSDWSAGNSISLLEPLTFSFHCFL